MNIITTIESNAEHDIEVIKQAFLHAIQFLEGKGKPVTKLTVHVTTPSGTQTVAATPSGVTIQPTVHVAAPTTNPPTA